MKEIKFRAWNKIASFMMDWKDFIGYEKDQISIVGNDYRVFNDDEFIIMEYTGLKDKNGKEIHEGDITAVFNFEDSFFRVKVVYQNGAFGYINIFDEFIPFASNNFSQWTDDKSKEIEVVGNIYENSDLLKEE